MGDPMTPQETQLLNNFLDQLTQVRGITKDPTADALIAKATAAQSDASYLLVQRALLLEQALEAAKAQNAKLEEELRSSRTPQTSGSFLNDPNAWGRGPSRAAPANTESSFNAARPMAAQPPAAAQPQSAGNSFLTNAAATAAGVVGGAFLFQGIGSLLGHGNQGLFSHGGTQQPPENVTVNNYYGEDARNDHLAEESSDAGVDTAMDDQSFDDDSSLA
jgi:hypothetical protein